MQKKTIIISSFVVLILIGVYSFIKKHSQVDDLQVSLHIPMDMERKKVEGPSSSPAPVQKPDNFANLDEEQTKKKFIKTRNLWIADPSFSPEEKNELILKLSQELFPDGNVPPETEADKKEQAKITALIEKLKIQSEEIKADKNLSHEEKEIKVKNLLNQFLIDVDR
ncbi:MAG: hypothetical protein U0T83_03735 [Bacteriovoracaceae bacterium]